VLAKLQNVQSKGYIAPGEVNSLTSYFAVPKGDDDIRMVYDASASGLNAGLWVPTFALPSAESLTDSMTSTSWMGDLDMEEQFLNFPLHPDLQCFFGIDLHPYLSPGGTHTNWLRWTRCMMGLRSSPYFAVQGTLPAEEVALGDPTDETNPLHWDHVVFNLPGSEAYNPILPWAMRVTQDGEMAGIIKRYVDDLWTVGHTVEHCWQVGHQLATLFSYLGLQIALRKSRPSTQHPGPWAGTIAFSCPSGVGVTCAADKWLKAKRLLHDLQAELGANIQLNRKSLESMHGFFVHLA
jgi:hypothetical protein